MSLNRVTINGGFNGDSGSEERGQVGFLSRHGSSNGRVRCSLTGEDLGIPLVGIVDLVVHGEAGPVVADFKTSARATNQVDIMHELQLSCYSYLFRQVTGMREVGLEVRSLIKTKIPKVEITRLEPRQTKHFVRLFSVIRAYLHAVRTGQYHIRPGIECSFCDFRGRTCMTGYEEVA